MATHDKRGAYIIVDHDEQDLVSAYAPIGNVYTQGFNTSLFTLSMPRNFRPMHSFSAYQVADFARVEGMHGVLMANQLAPEVLDQPASAWGPPDYESYIQTKVCPRSMRAAMPCISWCPAPYPLNAKCGLWKNKSWPGLYMAARVPAVPACISRALQPVAWSQNRNTT